MMRKCVCAVFVVAWAVTFTASAKSDNDQSLLLLEAEANCAFISVFARESILASLDNVPFNHYLGTVAAQTLDESQKALYTNIARKAYDYVDQEGRDSNRNALITDFQNYWHTKCMQPAK